MCSAGQHHPAVAFAADRPHRSSRMVRATFASPTGARTNRAPRGPGRILHHQAGREVHHHGRGCRRQCCVDPTRPGPRTPACSPRRSRCPVSSTSASRSTSGSTASPMSAPLSPHQPPSSPRFSGTGSGARGKRPSGSRLMPLTRQPSRSSSGEDRDRAGAAHAVERDLEAAGAGSRRRRSSAARARRRGAARPPPRSSRTLAEAVPARSRRALPPPARAPAAPASASRKIPSGPTNLSAFHSIGLWLAVRIRPAAGVMVLDRQLHRRRRHHADVDHVHADRHEARPPPLGEHRLRWSGRRGRAPRPGGWRRRSGPRREPDPGAQRRRVAGHQLRREVGADVSPHPGDADHQGVGHRRGPARVRWRCGSAASVAEDARRNASTTRGRSGCRHSAEARRPRRRASGTDGRRGSWSWRRTRPPPRRCAPRRDRVARAARRESRRRPAARDASARSGAPSATRPGTAPGSARPAPCAP